MGGCVQVLRLPDPELPDVAHLEHLGAAIYPDRPADLDYRLWAARPVDRV